MSQGGAEKLALGDDAAKSSEEAANERFIVLGKFSQSYLEVFIHVTSMLHHVVYLHPCSGLGCSKALLQTSH